jgi:peptidase A4-like protein
MVLVSTVVGTAGTAPAAATSPANSLERLISHGCNAADVSNWCGYAETGSGYTSATATWTVPSVSPTSSDTYSAAWVGIDGYGNSDLIQAGTESNYANDRIMRTARPSIRPGGKSYRTLP